MPFRPRIWFVAAARLQRLAVGTVGRWSAPRRRPLPSRCAGAHERRGAACADPLPADSSSLPVKGCSSGRESGSLRLPGWAAARQWAGFGALEARRDVDRWFSAARTLASGEERLVPTSSRLILHLSRLKIAVPAANLVRWRALSSSGWGRALKRAATPSAGSRAAPGARERRGAACADLLPDTISPFPVKGCSSSRESG